jgi:hypothetical protein
MFIQTMRAGVLIAAVALSVIPASANCEDTLGEQHYAVQGESEWFSQAVEDALGSGTSDFDFDNFVQCRKMLPVARRRLELVEGILAADAKVADDCVDMTEDDLHSSIGGTKAPEMRSILKEYIAVCKSGEGEQ